MLKLKTKNFFLLFFFPGSLMSGSWNSSGATFAKQVSSSTRLSGWLFWFFRLIWPSPSITLWQHSGPQGCLLFESFSDSLRFTYSNKVSCLFAHFLTECHQKKKTWRVKERMKQLKWKKCKQKWKPQLINKSCMVSYWLVTSACLVIPVFQRGTDKAFSSLPIQTKPPTRWCSSTEVTWWLWAASPFESEHCIQEFMTLCF